MVLLVTGALLTGALVTLGSTVGAPPAVAVPETTTTPAVPGTVRDAASADADEVDPEEQARLAAEEAARERLRAAELAVSRARAAIRDAEAALTAARRRGGAADGAVRRAEELLPAAILDRIELRADLEAVERELDALRETRVELGDDLIAARDAFASQVVRTFKVGHAGQLTGSLAVLREARDPGELARGLAELQVVTRAGARSVREVEAEIDAVEQELADARERRAELAAQLADATRRAEDAEGTAAAAREVAADGESRVVAAMEAALEAERALAVATRSRDGRLEAVAELVKASPDESARGENAAEEEAAGTGDRREAGPAAGDEEVTEADFSTRVREVRGRRRAHERATRLSAAARRATDAWVCPFDGARFANDWAFPRSGARRHEGTDVFGDRGTPIVAVAAGTVAVLDATEGRGDLGGITVTIAQGGSRQYYAHLERIEPTLRRGREVEAGDRIGWVGTTGNARGTPPHLHLGWYVEDVAVNPFASLAVACDGRSAPLRDGDVVPPAAAFGSDAGAPDEGDRRR